MPANREAASFRLPLPPGRARARRVQSKLFCSPISGALALAVAAIAILPGVAQTAAQTAPPGEIRSGGMFAMGVPVTRELRDKQTDLFTFDARAGQRLYMVVNQQGLNLAVSITTPTGKLLLEADSQPADKNQKPISALCPETGSYGIRISGFSSPSSIGSYRIELIRQQVGDRQNEAATMHSIGLFYSDLEKHQRALTYYQKELPLRQQLGDRNGEAASLNNIGWTCRELRQSQKALRFLQAALTIERQMNQDREEAVTLDNIGGVYWNLSQWQMALTYFDRALAIERRTRDHRAEAMTQANLGWTYHSMQQQSRARSYLQEALDTQRQLDDRRQEIITLGRVGTIDQQRGSYTDALGDLQQALAILPIDDPRGKVDILNNMAALYRKLGQWQKAMALSQQAFPIAQQVEDSTGAAETLNGLGLSYKGLAQYPRSIACHEAALKLWRKAGDQVGEAESLNDLGFVSLDSGQPQKAVFYFQQALPIEQARGQRRGEASTLHNIGKAYWALGQQDKALADELAALQLRKELADPEGEGNIETTLMEQYRDRSQPELAIQFGRQAVNSFQQLRKSNDHLDGDLQAGFLHWRSGTYRELAELLKTQNRFAEAEQVLDLLKQDELKEYARRS